MHQLRTSETVPDQVGLGAEAPTRVRYRVVGLAVLLAMVTYLDRISISTLAKDIMRDLKLSETQMGYVFSAFILAYAIFEIPTAFWADRKGTRHVLARIVVWWSTFTMATAAATSYAWLLVTRFLFGMGEAGAWPCVASTFSRWIPAKERGTVQGVFFVGAHLSGGVTPILVTAMAAYLNWRAIFVMFGLVGFAWTATWLLWFRDDPAQHPNVNRVELQSILAGRGTPSGHHTGWEYWRRLFADRNIWPLCVMYIANTYAFYFCITWLPTYLDSRFGLGKAALGLMAGMPLTLSIFGDVSGGMTSDWLGKRFGLRVGRSVLGSVAYGVATAAMFAAAWTTQPTLAIFLISVAVAAAMFTLGAAWGTCLDIGGQHAGVVSATMNTAGQVGAIASPVIAVYVKDHCGGWNAPLYLMSGLFVLGTFSWLLIDPRRQVFE
jgi:MFS transporter, ACS family, glucarate transporter